MLHYDLEVTVLSHASVNNRRCLTFHVSCSFLNIYASVRSREVILNKITCLYL